MDKAFINEREIAINIVMDIQRDALFNNLALKKALEENELTKGQRGIVTELVNGVLRNKIYIEYCINMVSKTPTEKMKPFILSLLLCSCYEIMYMKTEVAFVCNEAVNLTKKKGFKNLAPFVNGVLRNFGRGFENKEFELIEGKDKLSYLSLKYSYPKWLVGYWNKYYGDKVEYICDFLNTSPRVSIAINKHKTNKDTLKKELEKESVIVIDGKVAENSLLLKNTSNLGHNKNFINGDFWVMDESSQKALDFIDFSSLDEKATVLDLCASPGGKSFYIKCNLPKETKIISCDIFPHKIELLEKGFKRMGFENYEVMLNDATLLNEKLINCADLLLVDAPCSGFGLLRKKPDIKYTKDYEDILALQKVQLNILDISKKYIKDKGVIVYSTCTLSYLENELVIEEFLKNNKEFVCEHIETFLPMSQNTEYKGYESDGFFVAMLRKVNNG
ncbi:MAG: 16S rRNA (cytosine(967)-C(5))-methyltransferase RsmB [Lachnospirales bacterium]